MCYSASWKRDSVPEHKFDNLDVGQFDSKNIWTKLRYRTIFLVLLKSTLVYIADIVTALNLIVFHGKISVLYVNPGKTYVGLPTYDSIYSFTSSNYAIYIFLGSIVISFLLLIRELKKGRDIIRSRDIAYSFTSVVAYRYYVIKDYHYYCFFTEIDRVQTFADKLAFFVYFTLKDWKRIIFAIGPRQIINILTLVINIPLSQNDLQIYYDTITGQEDVGTPAQVVALLIMVFSSLFFIISALIMLAAVLVYFPLLCHIQGNLKEYCCYKIDKRIAEILNMREQMPLAASREVSSPPVLEQRFPMGTQSTPPIIYNVSAFGTSQNSISNK